LDFNLAVGSLLASTILFFVPLALLAMTGPYLVRVITASLTGLGANVGRLISVGTLGSLAGTLLIGYALIPYLPNSLTMYFTALALLLVCAGYFGICRKLAPAAVSVGLIVAAAIGGKFWTAPKPMHPFLVERFRGNSHFGQLQVVERKADSHRFYLNDYLTQ